MNTIDFERLTDTEFDTLQEEVERTGIALLERDHTLGIIARCECCHGYSDAAWMESDYVADADDIIASIQHHSDCDIYQANIREDNAQQLVDSIRQEPVLI